MKYDELLTFFQAVKQDRDLQPLQCADSTPVLMGHAEPSEKVACLIEKLTGEQARRDDERMSAMISRLTREPVLH